MRINATRAAIFFSDQFKFFFLAHRIEMYLDPGSFLDQMISIFWSKLDLPSHHDPKSFFYWFFKFLVFSNGPEEAVCIWGITLKAQYISFNFLLSLQSGVSSPMGTEYHKLFLDRKLWERYDPLKPALGVYVFISVLNLPSVTADEFSPNWLLLTRATDRGFFSQTESLALPHEKGQFRF